MDKIQTGENMGKPATKASDIDYNGAQNQPKPRSQTRGTAQLAAGVHLLPTGGIFKSAAVEVLRREQRLMATGEICKLALEWGLLTCTGKTPEATMASSLYGDIKRNDGGGVFFRPRGGMFGLKEWIEQGVFPSEALTQPVSRQIPVKKVTDASHSNQKRKRQRKIDNSSLKPPGSKRPHQTGGTIAAVAAGGAEAETVKHTNSTMQAASSSLGGSNLPIDQLQRVLQKDITNKNKVLIDSTTPGNVGGTLTVEQQPRRRLLTSESNEIGTSAATVTRNSSSLPTADPAAPAARKSQQDWVHYVVAEQEIKVAAVENKWGPLHPRAGQAHLLLYKACKQHAVRFPSVESRAQTALTRAYDILMFNNHVEELGKMQGLW